ncbi:MAG: Formimidoyltetrahydrofolate cyclodeaminase [Conexibacter sp.]|nr:Formimidoyltetrahydrofolate cyclodeaminase [Conexibacter sp.]
MLLAVPNVSEGRDEAAIDAIASAFADHDGVRLLDVHRDADHNRSVVSLAGAPGALAPALLAGTREALRRIDLRDHAGVHPKVGAVDVAPIVHRTPGERGAACAEALLLGNLLADELALPCFLYGALAQGRTRAEIRRGGPDELARRLTSGELEPDFGPAVLHPHGGATLVGARPPLVAFNLVLAPPATLATAREIAVAIREGGGEGLPGLRAIGLALERQGRVQVSMNVEDPVRTPLHEVVAAVRRHAPVAGAELVGLAPQAAFDGFPPDLPIPGFDPARHLIERVLDGPA